MRASTQTIFYVEDAKNEAAKGKYKEVTAEAMAEWTDGKVYYWPIEAQTSNEVEKPLEVRLLRIAAKKKKKDVWLVTNVLVPKRLTVEMAGKYYRMRWENEGFFRSYKHTLNKVNLSGRTVATVHREVLGSMLGVQLLMTQGLAAAVASGKQQVALSVRKLVLLARREMLARLRGKSKRGFLSRAAECRREQRNRTSNKQKRIWSARKEQKTINPPRIREMSEDAKCLLNQFLCNAA